MNDRRRFIVSIGVRVRLQRRFDAFGQPQGKVWRVGVLSIGSATTARHLVEAFFQGMADLGYQDDRNVRYEVRYGEGSFEKFEQYAREHVDAKVDLIGPLERRPRRRHKKRPRRFRLSSLSSAIPSIQG